MAGLFDSLDREEGSQTHFAKRAIALENARKEKTMDKANAVKNDLCSHKRRADSCWTCHPDKGPSCKLCKDMKIVKIKHKEGSAFCELQQLKHSMQTKANAANSISFNVDSGASSHIVKNKQALDIYATGIHHPIIIADGTRVNATEIGTINGP